MSTAPPALFTVLGFYRSALVGSLKVIVALAWDQALSKTIDQSGLPKLVGPWLHAFLVTTLLIFVNMTEVFKAVEVGALHSL